MWIEELLQWRFQAFLALTFPGSRSLLESRVVPRIKHSNEEQGLYGILLLKKENWYNIELKSSYLSKGWLEVDLTLDGQEQIFIRMGLYCRAVVSSISHFNRIQLPRVILQLLLICILCLYVWLPSVWKYFVRFLVCTSVDKTYHELDFSNDNVVVAWSRL